MKITDKMVQAALDEAGSGWASHLWGDARTDLMRDAIRAALTATPTSAEREKAKRAFLAGWMRYDTASDVDTQRAHAEFDAWWPEKTPV